MGVIDDLKHHILVDGFHVVADLQKSKGSWIIDQETGKEYLDCYSQFASQALGWNHPTLNWFRHPPFGISSVISHKLANSDMYSETYRDFVETFKSITPDFRYYFFIEGGALAVENALKAAFDWKYQLGDRKLVHSDGQNLDVIHLREAFHGRSGYTMSLTNTGELKTKWFPKFKWTRVTNPKIHHPMIKGRVQNLESLSLQEMHRALQKGNVAAIIIEPIQGEGGDNHFRKEYFQALRKLADDNQALLIFDEVQTGLGMTGKMWAYEHFGVVPDILVFGKKTQVCGIASTTRIDKILSNVFHVSGRINSTWGGNIVDMARAKAIIDVIKDENLVDNAKRIGLEFLATLETLPFPEVTNKRGKGLMLAFDLPDEKRRDQVYKKLSEKMIALKCGQKSIRFRPHLTFSSEDVSTARTFISEALS